MNSVRKNLGHLTPFYSHHVVLKGVTPLKLRLNQLPNLPRPQIYGRVVLYVGQNCSFLNW